MIYIYICTIILIHIPKHTLRNISKIYSVHIHSNMYLITHNIALFTNDIEYTFCHIIIAYSTWHNIRSSK